MRAVFIVPAALLLTLCGCANPSQFQPAITSFSSASDSAATSFAALDASSASDLNAIRANEALAAKRVAWDEHNCQQTSHSCSLYFKEKADGPTLQVYYNSLMPNSVAFVNGIKDYANALDALEKADASADVKSAFGKAMAAVSGIAGALNVPAGAAATAISTPLTAVADWGFVQYQNSLKLEALQKATKAADTIIQASLPVLNHETELASGAQVAEFEKILQAKDSAFLGKPSAETLHAEIQAANSLNTALTANTPALFTALADAHAKLTLAVKDPNVSMSDMAAAMTTFVQQAQNVRQIVTQLTTASPAKS